jgi:hypothetical protein
MKRLLCITLLFALAWAGAAQANTVPIDIELVVNGVSTVYCVPIDMTSDCAFRGTGRFEGNGYEVNWRMEGSVDPALTIAFSFVNLTAGDVSVLYLATLPVTPLAPPTVTGGSLGGSITDGNGDGVVLSDFSSAALYSAEVNGTSFQTLYDAPFAISSGVPFQTALIPVQSFGIPGLTVPGPGVTVNDIGILLSFTLSPHDAVAFTGNFVVEPAVVPEPATLGLVLLGMAGFARRALRGMKRR